jgi:hypothetical protein
VVFPACAELFCGIVHAIAERGTLDTDLFLELEIFSLLQEIEDSGNTSLTRAVNHLAGALIVRGFFDLPNITFKRMLASAHRLCAVDAEAAVSALWLASLFINRDSVTEFAGSDAGQFFIDEYTDLPLTLRLELTMFIWELVAAAPADAGWFFEEADLAVKTLEICIAADDELTIRVLACAGGLLRWMEQYLPDELSGVIGKFAVYAVEFTEWADECKQLMRNQEIVDGSRELAKAIDKSRCPAV